MQCESCRRPLSDDLLRCPRRQLGQNRLCPYQMEQRRLSSQGWGWMLFIGVGMSLLPLTALLIGEGLPVWVKVVLLPLLALGLFMIAFGLNLLFGTQQVLFNLETGQTWQRTTVFSLTVSQTLTSAIEIIPWKGIPARVLRYPASVVELCRGGKASELISTALLQLMAQDVVSIGEIKVYRKLRKPSRVFVLVPGVKYEESEVRGALEKRLKEVVGLAKCTDSEFNFLGKKFARTHRATLCLEDAIEMVLGKEQATPDQFLISEVVGKEAVNLGLGEIRGYLRKTFSVGENTSGKVSLDIQSIDQLHRDFWATQPEDASDLLAQIDLRVLSIMPSKRETRD